MYLQETARRTLPQLLEQLANGILDYALVLAAVGTISMALLELLKAAFRLRLWFHRMSVRSWFKSHPKELHQLLFLAIGGEAEASAFYDQPTSKMMGQMQSAANVVLDFPEKYPDLYDFLTRAPEEGKDKSDASEWRSLSKRAPLKDEDLRLATQARARLEHLVARKLDALQTKLEYRWARLNQAVAVTGGTVLLLFLLSPDGPVYFLETAREPVSEGERVLLSLMGGLLAPFAKDVVTALTGLRTRRS